MALSIDASPGSARSDIDLFSDGALEDPYPLYRELRDIGPAAWLTRHDCWFIGRHEDVRRALGDWQTFSSAKGIGLNATINHAWANALICVDPPVHTEMRTYLTERLSPRALKPVEQQTSNEVAIRSDPLTGEDLFVIADQIDADGTVYFKVFVKPLVNLIWIAGLVSVLGVVEDREGRQALGAVSDRHLLLDCAAAGHEPRRCPVWNHVQESASRIEADQDVELPAGARERPLLERAIVLVVDGDRLLGVVEPPSLAAWIENTYGKNPRHRR